MRRQLFIPPEVREAIATHIRDGTARAVEVFEFGAEEEDTLTGQMGLALHARQKEVRVNNDGVLQVWKWSMYSTKFRGRGRGAAESVLGADGIFELRVQHPQGDETKSLLFQAKKQWHRDPSLFEQCVKLSTWREAALVVDYSPNGISAFPLDAVIQAEGIRQPDMPSESLDRVLSDAFLVCTIGDNDLRYERPMRLLQWRTRSGEVVATHFQVKQRLRINVKPPRRTTTYDRLIPPAEAFRYRMDSAPADLLGLSGDFDRSALTDAKRRAASVYHPDRYQLNDRPEILKILTLRMQEKMEAERILGEKLKRAVLDEEPEGD